MSTVSSATRKMEMHNAVYARRVARGGLDEGVAFALGTVCSLAEDTMGFSMV